MLPPEDAAPLLVEDFAFDLPPDLIAQYPADRRSDSRLLTLDRATGACRLLGFSDFPSLVRPEDCLVVNDSKVLAARLHGRKEGPGEARIEALLLRDLGGGEWLAMLRPGRRVKPGTRVLLDEDPACGYTVIEHRPDGVFRLAFGSPDVESILARCGHMPLPPYIGRADTALDRERYQTVYARAPGSVAAPTAGLHFTEAILERLRGQGTAIARVTLHVGPGTFRPVKVERLTDHVMHEEHFELTAAAAATINERRAAGGRVIAVGTTSVRVLESCAVAEGRVEPRAGSTRIFLHPPMRPRVVQALLTNFHLPRSTLLMLVCTFAPREQVLAAYRLAVRERCRFYSYGDCMFVHEG